MRSYTALTSDRSRCLNPDARERLVDALYRIVREIRSTEDLPSLLRTITETARDLLEGDAAALFLYDDERGDLYFEVLVGGAPAARKHRIALGQGIAGAAAARLCSVISHDLATDPRHSPLPGVDYTVRDAIATPMARSGRLIGVLQVLNRTTGRFEQIDARILEILAEQAGVLIEEARLLHDKLRAERLAALGRVSTGLAHYINNVLNQWQGSSALIDVGLDQGNLDLVRRSWGLLKRSNARITELVSEMLELSKTRQPERSPVAIGEVVMHVLQHEGPRAARAGVTLRVEGAPVPAAMLDRRGIYEVVTNLVSNALDALRDSEVQQGEVTVRTGFGDAMITLEVSDNGPGMAPHVRQRMFEPFFSTKGSRGTGLGLSLVQKTVEEHGGTVVASVPEGGGTRFTVQVPFVAASATPVPL